MFQGNKTPPARGELTFNVGRGHLMEGGERWRVIKGRDEDEDEDEDECGVS